MFCRHVCTYMVYISLYRLAYSVCISINDGNRDEKQEERTK